MSSANVGRGAFSLNTNVGMGRVLSDVKRLDTTSPAAGAIVMGSTARSHAVTDFAKIWVW